MPAWAEAKLHSLAPAISATGPAAAVADELTTKATTVISTAVSSSSATSATIASTTVSSYCIGRC